MTRRTFGPLFSEDDREIYGCANNTGHGGCWIHGVACEAPDCIMADVETLEEIDLREVALGLAGFDLPDR